MNVKKMLFLLFILLAVFAMPAMAQGTSDAAVSGHGWAVPIGAGIGMGIAVGLAGLGQGRVAGSACESLARNPAGRPGIQLALILGLAFIESLVLFALVIMFVKVV